MLIPVPRPAPISDQEFRMLRELIRRVAGIQLGDAKRELLGSRLARRLRHHGFTRYQQYVDHLRFDDRDGSELREMVNCVTTNKTSFFREPHHFEFLAREVFRGARGRLSLWSAGCSTGEEPYSLAILAREIYGATALERVAILGSDIDTTVLEAARAGIYDGTRLEDVPRALRGRHFVRPDRNENPGRVRVHPDTAALVRFQQVNLAADPLPVSGRFDVILCRNVLIYLATEVRDRLIEQFATRLIPGGHLVLGHAEIVNGHPELFEPLGQTIFRRRPEERPAPLRVQAASAGPRAARAKLSARTGAAAGGSRTAVPERRIVAGGVYASGERELVRTVLGSCVAACLYDPVARVGGMNHFMLPDGGSGGLPTRYGVHAMEVLINQIMRRGGERRRLRAKAFGAASLLDVSAGGGDVALANARFVREFLATERIPLLAERLGGERPLDVRMVPCTGQVFVRALGPERAAEAALQERRYRAELSRLATRPADITLFLEDR